jgi:hypothetical protein
VILIKKLYSKYSYSWVLTILPLLLLSFILTHLTLNRFTYSLKESNKNKDVKNTTSNSNANVIESYGNTPLIFEANEGQVDSTVDFLARGVGYNLFLSPQGAVFSLSNATKDKNGYPELLHMNLLGANSNSQEEGLVELPSKSNYLVGNNTGHWKTNVTNYSKVGYKGVYPGIDLVYYGNQKQLEYDFVVSPGANPHDIKLELSNAESLKINGDGGLTVGMKKSEVTFNKPQTFQEVNGIKQEIASSFVIGNGNRVTFNLGMYDKTKPLIIDPVLVYSTYFGGSSDDTGFGIAADTNGNAYITGLTSSANFPTSNALYPSNGGNDDVFVVKLDSTGQPVYSTYIGGSDIDYARSITVDNSGNVYMTGVAHSANFPITTGAYQQSKNTGDDAFVIKLNSTGSSLVFSTFIGGNGNEFGNSITTDADNNVYITGYTGSSDFPTINAIQTTNPGNSTQAFVSKLNSTGTALIYSTYLGGTGGNVGRGIAVDSSGNATIVGDTGSTDFPIYMAYQPAIANGYGILDGFVSKLNASGTSFIYSTYLGGANYDQALGVAVDNAGNAYVTGVTSSTNFPMATGSGSGFLVKFNSSGSPVYSKYLVAFGLSIALDSSNKLFIAGTGGNDVDVYVAKLNSLDGTLVSSTFFGGNQFDFGRGIATDNLGNAYVTGNTSSLNFPTTNSYQSSSGGSYDMFVSKLSFDNVAPIVGAITAPTDPQVVNSTINVSANFTDQDNIDTHTAVWDWGDGTSVGTVNENNGFGTVTGSHTYMSPGVYTLKLTVTDNNGASGESTYQYIVVYDPSAGYVTGAGTITSPLGAYTLNPLLTGKAIFGFVSRYQNGANVPTGSTQFRFVTAQFTFNSTSYDWLVVGGPKAQYKGSGTINGNGDYGFILTSIDGQINGGGGTDKFRIKIYDKTTNLVIYDNQIGALDTSDPTTVIDSGSIMIHH